MSSLFLDTTILGQSLLGPGYRVGIYRTVVELLHELVPLLETEQHQDLALFCSKPSMLHLTEAYLSNDALLKALPFFSEWMGKHPEKIKAYSEELFELREAKRQIKAGEVAKPKSVSKLRLQLAQGYASYKVKQHFRRSFNRLRQATQNAKLAHYFYAEHLANDNSFFPSKLKRVVTVYDLTALVNKECRESNPGFSRSQAEALALIQPSDTVICISESCRQDLLSHYPQIRPEQCRVTLLGASGNFYPVQDAGRIEATLERYSIPKRSSYLLSVCTLAPHKNLKQVIKSFLAMVEEEGMEDLNLVLTGTNGLQHEQIREMLEAYPQLKRRVIFTGYVNDEDLAPLYSGALGFVFASLYEGFGLPILEAMQCGTPVISSNTASMPEVGGDAVLYTDPRDGETLSQHMLNLYENDTLRGDLKTKGLEQAAKFSWRRCAEETWVTYQQVLTS